MKRLSLILASIFVLTAAWSFSENLVLPAFAHNVAGVDGMRWSSEIYLTNPGHQPVQVTLMTLLPGHVKRSAPCDLFMPPTRVVPPRSAVVWTAGGLAVDLGCAEEALGGLVLNADGPIHITSRMVSHREGTPSPLNGVLVGQGQEVRVLTMDELPPAGDYLLPSLTWSCDSWDPLAFDTFVGFANPGVQLVTVQLELSNGPSDGVAVVDGVSRPLPVSFDVPAGSWKQVRLSMAGASRKRCTGPENFDLLLRTNGSVAMYASVVDRSSNDARTVDPVALD